MLFGVRGHLSLSILLILLATCRGRILAASVDSNPATTEGTQLPSDCLTYAQRYHNANDMDRLDSIADKLDPRSTKVVLLKLHITQAPDADLLLSLHAMAIEVMEAGWHFFILLQGEEEATRSEMLHFLPKSLRQFLVVHDYHNSLRMYPRLGEALEMQQGRIPGPAAGYLAEVAFMHQYHKYTFMFCVEYDVRYVGHWGEFLNASLRKANESPGHDFLSVLEEEHMVNATRTAAAALPGPADLIVYSQLNFGDKWQSTATNLELGENSWDTFIMLYGGSRKMFNHLHEMSLAGHSVYVEALLPTAAYLHGLKVVRVPEATPYHYAYHCCFDNAESLYRDFALSQTCTKNMLVHPIKKDVTMAGPMDFSLSAHHLE